MAVDDEPAEIRTLRALASNGAIRPIAELTDTVMRQVANGIAGGLFPEHAFSLAGVDPALGAVWVEQGKRGEHPYANLVRMMAEAEAKFAASATIAIHEGGNSWTGKLTLLQVRFPHLYGKPERGLKSAKGGGEAEAQATGTDGQTRRVRLTGLDAIPTEKLGAVHDMGQEAARRKRKREDG